MARSPRLLAESPQYGCRDQLSCLGWIIVLPDTHDQPADLGESGVGVPVPLDVATDLGGPVLDVGLRLDVVLGATVPVAAINECSYPSLPEDEIGPAVQLWERPSAYSVAQPEADAVDRAREIIQNVGGGELVTHNRQGQIRDKDTIAPAKDPYPPAG